MTDMIVRFLLSRLTTEQVEKLGMALTAGARAKKEKERMLQSSFDAALTAMSKLTQ